MNFLKQFKENFLQNFSLLGEVDINFGIDKFKEKIHNN